MKKIKLEKMIVEGKELYYFNLGSEDYFKPIYRIFVNKNLIKFDNNNAYIEFPCINCEMIKKDNFNLVIKPGNKNAFTFEVEAGFRGTAEIKEIDAYQHEYNSYPYEIYHSERGSTGISKGVIVITDSEKVKIRWHRDGRLYGKPSKGTTIIYLNGNTENADNIENINNILEDLE
jgi:hypothetical protein